MDGLTDAEIRSAAAEIAGHGLIDVRIRRCRVAGEQRRRGHDLSGLTVAALGHIDLAPGPLERMGTLRREPLDGGDLHPAHGGDGRHARTHGDTVEVDGARAALADAAAVFRAFEVEQVPQNPEQRRVGRRLDRAGPAVDVQVE